MRNPLVALTPAHVQHLLTAMETAGASARLRQLTYAVLHRALNQAVRWNMIPRNVCDAVTRPRVARKAMHVLTAAQVGDFLKAARGDRLEALYVVAVSTGVRWGELTGLTWTDLDLMDALLGEG